MKQNKTVSDYWLSDYADYLSMANVMRQDKTAVELATVTIRRVTELEASGYADYLTRQVY